MAQDLYNPQIQQSNFSDKMSDRFLGTNHVDTKNLLNNYELQKTVNINKYGWNFEGMKNVGINPLMNMGALGNVSSSQAQSNQSSDVGTVGDFVLGEVKDILQMVSPVQQAKEFKQFAKNLMTRRR